jgi:hypothetical protein
LGEKLKKGVCDMCSAGEEKPVRIYQCGKAGESGHQDDTFMCRICLELGLSAYPSQNHEFTDRVDLSRAVQVILNRLGKGVP